MAKLSSINKNNHRRKLVQQYAGKRKKLKEIADDLKRWGIKLEQAYVRDVGVRPEVERQILASVSARLERAMADVEEKGRLAVARIEAETSVSVAELVAQAMAASIVATCRTGPVGRKCTTSSG